MEKTAGSLTDRPALRSFSAAYQEARSKIASLRGGKKTVDEAFEKYNSSTNDGEVDSAILGPRAKPLRRLPRAVSWLLLVCWMTFVYFVTFYTITFLEGNTIIIAEK